jgi:FtsP/CotA-like multicopper oxidase with cupredoxin domain
VANLDFWIQLEHRPWDICPHNINRMSGQSVQQIEGTKPQKVTLSSVDGSINNLVTMYKPLTVNGEIVDALILRRYQPARTRQNSWTIPDDRKVNPWDLNEPDPTDTGTMGTIPGPVIECNVGDKVTVHFRNHDLRTQPGKSGKSGKKVLLPVEMRTHSLHPHGFAFAATSDGAYPLSPPADQTHVSPPDEVQATDSEGPAWGSVGVLGHKKGDRVPPLGTFDYTWIAGAPSEEDTDQIEPWPTTAGVWLYHDHSICDMANVFLGAIGIIVIHNPDDPEEVDIRSSPTSSDLDPLFLPGGSATGPVTHVGGLGQRPPKVYWGPPSKALYLQLFHELSGASGAKTGEAMLINGRQYLGNTPTLIAGPDTLMRLGVVGMGNNVHTFHIHGHRWAIPGPDGTSVPQEDPSSFQNSAQIRAVSQFEDTRLFGPANSFFFTIKEGEFFGARDDNPAGEYHMHCHVLSHMDMGMMGSLLILSGQQPAFAGPLPQGKPCPEPPMAMQEPKPGTNPKSFTVKMVPDPNTPGQFVFDPSDPTKVAPNAEITFKNTTGDPHSIVWDQPTPSNATKPPDTPPPPNISTSDITVMMGDQPGTFPYHCGVHGQHMHGTLIVG